MNKFEKYIRNKIIKIIGETGGLSSDTMLCLFYKFVYLVIVIIKNIFDLKKTIFCPPERISIINFYVFYIFSR